MILLKKFLLPVTILSVTPILFLIPKYTTHNTDELEHFKLFVAYNGQADILLSLQIQPDYYPYQFKQKSFYDYLTNTKSFMVSNSSASDDKKELVSKFQERLNKLLHKIKEKGDGLWDNGLYESGLVYRNPQFWLKKKVDYIFLEQFIQDDHVKPFGLISSIPQHKKIFTTNFRLSRDPYLVFDKSTFDYFKNNSTNSTTNNNNSSDNFNKHFYNYYKNYNKTHRNSLYRFAKFIEFWNKNILESTGTGAGTGTGTSSTYPIVDDAEQIFAFEKENKAKDKQLAELYQKAIFSDEEINLLNQWSSDSKKPWKMNYFYKTHNDAAEKANFSVTSFNKLDSKKEKTMSKNKFRDIVNLHHPSLEHQTLRGTSPLAEGTQKDVMIYLKNFSKSLKQLSQDGNFENIFKNDDRKDAISNAENNAQLIYTNYQTRLCNIRNYFKKIGVIDNNFNGQKGDSTNDSKTLSIVTYPPASAGGGNASIQSISKFPFIYKDLGFKQYIPNLDNVEVDDVHDHHGHDHSSKEEQNHENEASIFSVDDNGWWWNIGNSNINKNNLNNFTGTADSIIFLTNPDDWNILNGGDSPKIEAYYSILKNESKIEPYKKNKVNTNGYKFSQHSYNLWNEGLRSPIALNLVLDNLVEIIRKQYGKNISDNKDDYKKALDWGNYWKDNFIKSTNHIISKQ